MVIHHYHYINIMVYNLVSSSFHMVVSINGGTPKWMVYKFLYWIIQIEDGRFWWKKNRDI
jgi:hypothetical protein